MAWYILKMVFYGWDGRNDGWELNALQILYLTFDPFIDISVIGIPIGIIGVFHDQINIGD